MHISDFDYELPPGLIAREPARPRDASRMMVLNRRTGERVDTAFRQLPEFLQAADVLVLNDTRVIPARIHGKLERASGTTREIEVLFAAPLAATTWEVMCKPGRRVRPGDRVRFAEGNLVGTFGGLRPHGLRLLHVDFPVEEFLQAHGRIPLPPYLERDDTSLDTVDYQTVYAGAPGAVAAPTAGLHFTDSMLEGLQSKGIEIVKLTLHTGIGTFLPVRTENPEKHHLTPERFELTEPAAARLNAAREEGRRIVAVGTTTTRTLEYVVQRHGRFAAGAGEADLFILPGYEFQAVGAILTNFHLPKSTLLMLVSAFASREIILSAYRHAAESGYRFYSYGDCMLLA